MDRATASNLAAWVNTHDDGTPQPRADVVPTLLGPPPGLVTYRVRILSTEALQNGARRKIAQPADSLAQARAILGY